MSAPVGHSQGRTWEGVGHHDRQSIDDADEPTQGVSKSGRPIFKFGDSPWFFSAHAAKSYMAAVEELRRIERRRRAKPN